MAVELKTKENNASVKKFIDAVSDKEIRKDCYSIIDMMKSVTKQEPKMWGTAIVGFGSYHYKYASGHEGDACIVGFSPRKNNISLYLMLGLHTNPGLMEKLGKHKTGKGCLYINSLEDVDPKILKKVINESYKAMKKHVAAMKK
jgi:hypothetical protein